jgi:galactokinase
VDEWTVPYVHPQASGNRVGVRWLRFLDASGAPVVMVDELDDLDVTVARVTDEELAAATHLEELPVRDECYVWIDARHRGVGSGAVGPDVARRTASLQVAARGHIASAVDDRRADALARATRLHRGRWDEPELVVRAPGRVNLIGEHTDYNDGFAMPMALPFDTVIALGSAGDDRTGPVTVEAEGFGEVTLDPSAISDRARVVAAPRRRRRTARGARRRHRRLHGSIATDVPIGAGLSSSAALEVASITALLARAGRRGSRSRWRDSAAESSTRSSVSDRDHGPVHLRRRRARPREPHGLQGEHTRSAPAPARRRRRRHGHGHATGPGRRRYAERRDACARAAAVLGVSALRDATLGDVESITDPAVRSRARHVVSENERTLAAAVAMERADVVELGRLMSDSHRSLRDDYEVSSPGLDRIVEVAGSAPVASVRG